MVKSWLLIFFLAFNFVYSQQISVEATTDSTYYLVGDYIHLKIRLQYDRGIKIEFPDVKDSIKSLEFISALDVRRSQTENQIVEEHEFIFSRYDSSSVTIPPVGIGYYLPDSPKRLVIKTNPLHIIIQTIRVDPRGKIQDVKKPITVSYNWLRLILIILAAMAVVGIIIYFWKKNKKEGKEQKVVKKLIIPPHKKALERLYRLEEEKLWQQGKVKEYHFEITHIIRTYFEERFGFLAMEMTSTEILNQLKEFKEAEKIIDLTKIFFENADMVKFAKFEPLPKVNEAMMKQAIEIVKATRQSEENVQLTTEGGNA